MRMCRMDKNLQTRKSGTGTTGSVISIWGVVVGIIATIVVMSHIDGGETYPAPRPRPEPAPIPLPVPQPLNELDKIIELKKQRDKTASWPKTSLPTPTETTTEDPPDKPMSNNMLLALIAGGFVLFVGAALIYSYCKVEHCDQRYV